MRQAGLVVIVQAHMLLLIFPYPNPVLVIDPTELLSKRVGM